MGPRLESRGDAGRSGKKLIEESLQWGRGSKAAETREF